jgi:hypothetical protein
MTGGARLIDGVALAKLIRAEVAGLPVSQARTKSFIDSAGARTSRVTVFMVPPRDGLLEV